MLAKRPPPMSRQKENNVGQVVIVFGDVMVDDICLTAYIARCYYGDMRVLCKLHARFVIGDTAIVNYDVP